MLDFKCHVSTVSPCLQCLRVGHKLPVRTWTPLEQQGVQYLVELELEAQHVAEGERFTHVGLDEGEEEVVLVRAPLIHFQDDVQHAVGVQVETACGDTVRRSCTDRSMNRASAE